MSTLNDQARSRKTVDLGILRQHVLDTINRVNMYASDGNLNARGYGWDKGNFYVHGDQSSIAIVNVVLGSLLHELGCYGGYNTRAWIAFCRCEKWHKIVDRLHAIDKATNDSKYWQLLRVIDHGHHGECKDFFGKSNGYLAPTEKEMARAKRIHDHYVRVLGL